MKMKRLISHAIRAMRRGEPICARDYGLPADAIVDCLIRQFGPIDGLRHHMHRYMVRSEVAITGTCTAIDPRTYRQRRRPMETSIELRRNLPALRILF